MSFPFHEGESNSPWLKSLKPTLFPKLNQNISADVCIIGAGIAGLLTAYKLLQEGKTVCIVEDFEIGSGQTGRSTAQATVILDHRYDEIERIHGSAVTAALAARSHHQAIKDLEEIILKENLDCDIRKIDAYLFADVDDDPQIITKELHALQDAKIERAFLFAQVPFPQYETGPALCFPDQIVFNPLKFVNELANKIAKKGGLIFTHSHVCEVKGGTQAFVKTKNGCKVQCQDIVVATNTPVNDRVVIHTKQASYRTYVMGFRTLKGSLPDAMYFDLKKPYHYVRLLEDPLLADYDIILVGGEDHKTGQNQHPEDCFSNLEHWARQHFPFMEEAVFRWSGQVMETMDGLAFIGVNPADEKNVYVITGHSGNGITYAMIGANLVTDLIHGRFNPYTEVYKPSRMNLRSLGTYLKENLNSAGQYFDWVVPKSENDLLNLPPGEGVVFSHNFKKIAAYKDENGNLLLHSAICPHLKGLVRWNSAEKSWDCPCHGSRFSGQGKVIEGPAISSLELLETITLEEVFEETPLGVWPKSL